MNVWAIVSAIIATVTAAAVIGTWKKLTSKKPGPDLQPLDDPLDVTNVEHETEEVGSGGDVCQSDKSKARVDVRVRNYGDRKSAITAALFYVRKLISVPPCGVGAGPIVASEGFEVELPRRLAEGETKEIRVNHEVGPDENDRFVFRIGREFSEEELGREYIYQLDVAIRHDGLDKPMKLGRVLVVLPGLSDRTLAWRAPSGCEIDTLRAYREAAELDGVRSPQLDDVFEAARQAP